MVAIIKTGYSIRRTFSYNENKVKEGVADLIMAQNYPMEAAQLSEQHRLNMLLKIAARRETVTKNSMHISLNFTERDFPVPPKDMPKADKEAIEKAYAAKLSSIAETYMAAMGLGEQPYLVYKHNDAGHPHCHIVTVGVRPDGTAVANFNNAKQSEKARKMIEKEYGLVRAEDHRRNFFKLKAVNAEKVTYGAKGTKEAISGTLQYLLATYKFTSLHELNAVLNLYNIHADAGSENSRVFKNKGLQYRVLNEHGQPCGVPVKASLFHNNPGLKYLQKRFFINQSSRQQGKRRLTSEIHSALHLSAQPTLKKLTSVLRKTGIQLVPRLNKDGFLYGVTYIDHQTKCVFNGSDLGKAYNASALRERCKPEADLTKKQNIGRATSLASNNVYQHQSFFPPAPFSFTLQKTGTGNLFQLLIQPVNTSSHLPPELRRKRKKKKRKQQNT